MALGESRSSYPPCASEAASGAPILSPRGRSPIGVTPDFRPRPPTPPAGRQPQSRGRTRREYPQVGLSHTLNFGHRPGPQTSATRFRHPGRSSHGHGRAASTADLSFLSRAPRPRSTAPRARSQPTRLAALTSGSSSPRSHSHPEPRRPSEHLEEGGTPGTWQL